MTAKPKATRRGWTPTMEQRADLNGRQVKCLIASEGHLWMRGYFDRLPPVVRRRLAESRFNICPACMDEEARMTAPAATACPSLMGGLHAVVNAAHIGCT